jgi:hypothetical protein
VLGGGHFPPIMVQIEGEPGPENGLKLNLRRCGTVIYCSCLIWQSFIASDFGGPCNIQALLSQPRGLTLSGGTASRAPSDVLREFEHAFWGECCVTQACAQALLLSHHNEAAA